LNFPFRTGVRSHHLPQASHFNKVIGAPFKGILLIG
jgi:hypothetical protein